MQPAALQIYRGLWATVCMPRTLEDSVGLETQRVRFKSHKQHLFVHQDSCNSSPSGRAPCVVIIMSTLYICCQRMSLVGMFLGEQEKGNCARHDARHDVQLVSFAKRHVLNAEVVSSSISVTEV